MQMNLTIMSIFGILALMGVVVNDSLVLVDFINRKVRSVPLLRLSQPPASLDSARYATY